MQDRVNRFNGSYNLKVHNVDLNERPFELIHAIQFHSSFVGTITVPAGYRTDFASVPRFFHRIISPVGRHGKAAIVHDWLCDEAPKTTDYLEAASIFDEAMEALGVSWIRRKAMVVMVKIGGPKFKIGDK
ncbi:MAG: hypothetical protein Unbinned1322contig1001_32 [Prokaryotic dsDNA virus sp.]|mgnify:CR=1 FL=1|nr:MAG: hypothetical protein Unbinned1322contig1001_32 [Prokaryotic dsDNA virus sp.]|tara:strand:- start:31305 stop:31694 length:390 start_codon:yes stop_codon:yes gene_type:complete